MHVGETFVLREQFGGGPLRNVEPTRKCSRLVRPQASQEGQPTISVDRQAHVSALRTLYVKAAAVPRNAETFVKVLEYWLQVFWNRRKA